MLPRSLVLAGLILAAIPGPASAASGHPLSFAPAVGGPLAAGERPTKVVSADFDQDGRADLAVADQQGDRVSVLIGDGAGGFAPATTTPVGDGPQDAAVGDVNGDGRPDLAVAGHNAKSVDVLLGDGHGGFTTAPGSPFATGPCTSSTLVADLNSDGFADVATANACGPATVTTLLGDGTGSFTPAPGFSIGAGAAPWGVAVADFDADGRRDLAVAAYGSNTVPVLLGAGDGTFTAAPGAPAASRYSPDAIVVGDFDENGRPDVVLANANSGNDGVATEITVLLGDGHGRFSTAPGPSLYAASAGTSVAVADLDGDGHQDVIEASDARPLIILLGDGHGRFTGAPGTAPDPGSAPSSVVATDLNGDGRPDLAVTSANDNTVSVFLNRPVVVPARPLAAPRLEAPRHCVSGARATFTVRGPQIRQVSFAVDDRRARRVLHANSGRQGFRMTISRSDLRPGARHTLRATIWLPPQDAPRVLTRKFRRCR
jgi:hypothetical protein